jgi:hypothetical protein
MSAVKIRISRIKLDATKLMPALPREISRPFPFVYTQLLCQIETLVLHTDAEQNVDNKVDHLRFLS